MKDSQAMLVQELVLYVASAALCSLVLFMGLYYLDPNCNVSKQALAQKKEIAKRLGRPFIQTNQCEVFYHALSKEEQLEALEEEKKILEEKKKLKAAGVIGSTVDVLGGAVGGAASLVTTGVTAGAGIIGSGVGAGAGLVGSGFHALSKAGKFMGKTVSHQFSTSKKNGNGSPVIPADGAGS